MNDGSVVRRATISDCGQYRYLLSHRWGMGPIAVWIMHNPSTADAEQDDPTIRRVTSFTRTLGCGGFDAVNLFAWRATDPKSLRDQQDAVGPANDRYILSAIRGAPGPRIAAWGAVQPSGHTRVMRLLQGPLALTRLQCLGTTKDGHPRHPLYLPRSSDLRNWAPAGTTPANRGIR